MHVYFVYRLGPELLEDVVCQLHRVGFEELVINVGVEWRVAT